MPYECFDIRESKLKKGSHAGCEDYDALASWLAQEIESALSGRSGIEQEIKYAWKLYQQDRTRSAPPWPNAADLTSPIARESVDAFAARLMQTIFVEPMYTVEGWGDAATRAPFVEEFHQRMVEEERLQGFLDEVTTRALVEGVGILRVSEGQETRRERKQLRAQWQTTPDGSPLIGEDNQPVIVKDGIGNPVEATDPNLPSVEGEFDVVEPVRIGPAYDVVPYLHQVLLPSHARTRTQVWGEGFRFYRRVPELTGLAKKGIYSTEAVEFLGEQDEKSSSLNDHPNEQKVVVDQRGPTAQKELWEVAFLADLDGDGERWWLATLSVERRKLLRLKTNDRTTRTFRFIPYPKPGSPDRGYSLITDVGRTVIEQDTAVRNMWADGCAMALARPILKRSGALWDEYEQPFGPMSVVTVRDKDEVSQLQMADVPRSIEAWHGFIRQDADRLFGQNDTSLGVDSGENNTLGEERLRAGYVEIRMDLLMKRMKEPLEELWHARHAIWKRTLASHESMTAPMQRALAGMSQKATQSVFGTQHQGVDFTSINDGRTVAAMLEGAFWGKPRGSVETADPMRQMQGWLGFMKFLPALMQLNPSLAVIARTPEASKSMLEQSLRVFKVPDKQAWLGPEAQAALDAFHQQQAMMQDPRMQMLMSLAGGQQVPGQPGQDGPPQQGPPQGGPSMVQ